LNKRVSRVPVYWNYVRYSTPEQQWGDSDRRQVDQGRSRAAALGVPFMDHYRDPGISAFKAKNRSAGALGQFLEDVRLGSPDGSKPWPRPGDILGVEDFDRLSRAEPMEAFDLFRDIINSGVVLQVREQQYTRDILRQQPHLFYLVLGELIRAHTESLKKSERGKETREKKREKARSGPRHAHASCPGWLIPTDDRSDYDRIDAHCNTMVRIFNWADSGIGAYVIARRLNAERVRTFDRRRKNPPAQTPGWHPAYVLRLLRNRAVIGEYQPCLITEDGASVAAGDPVPDHYPAVIDPALFRRVQKALDERGTAGRGRKGRYFSNIVTGLGFCHRCGGSLTFEPASKPQILRKNRTTSTSYLRCSRSRRGLCENHTGFPYPRFEELLFLLFEECMEPMLIRLMPAAQCNDLLTKRLADIETKIAQSEEIIARLYQTFMRPGDAPASLIERTESEIRKVNAETTLLRREHEKFDQAIRDAEAANPAGLAERVRAVRAQLDATTDPEQRYDARAKVNALLRGRILIRLYDDRSISVTMSGLHGLLPGAEILGVTFTPDRIVSGRAYAPDATLLYEIPQARIAALDGSIDRFLAGENPSAAA
jgi:DNA invertase Pin-like site-specific DNA recombinase